MDDIVEILKRLWNVWQLRGSVLLSLFLQVILILTGNLRKRNSSKLITFVLWLAYLSADWVATFALGSISNILNHLSLENHNPDILCFWTPFLLLHLGGPDTITAFSLEDNQLWLRHGLSLLFQLIAVFYIFARSLRDNMLVFPTLCVFIAGVLKYGERTWALSCASMDGLRASMLNGADPGPNYRAIMDDFSSKLNAGIPVKLNASRESDATASSYGPTALHESTDVDNLDDPLQLLGTAYRSFQSFKPVFVDLILSFKEQDASRSIFSRISASQAYKVVEVELNFIYDALYTKALVAHTPLGCVIRVLNFSLILTACLSFFFVDKDSFHEKDVYITYFMLVGASALEIVSLGLLIISDWTLVMLRNSEYYPNLKWAEQFLFKILTKFRPTNKPRWSHSMGQYSLLRACFQDPETMFARLLARLNVKELFDQYKFTESINVPEGLEVIILNDLKNKSEISEDIETGYQEFTASRGERSLQQDEDCSGLKWSVIAEFDESLLLWHLATDICYCCVQGTNNPEIAQYREASKLISRYMGYLLIACPLTLSMAGLGLIRYRDTCAELIQFFKEEKLIGDESGANKMPFLCMSRGIVPEKTRDSNACEILLSMHTDVPPKRVKGDRSKSVLWDAVELAKQLKDLDEEKMWKITCNVWLEMLCFAAQRCRGICHAQLLSTGGELLTFAWLLEAHLGMGEFFQIRSGHVTTNVILES